MTELDVKKYLKSSYDSHVAHLLHLYLMNDYSYYQQSFLPAVEYAKRKIKKGDYNSILFVQCIKLGIDKTLGNYYFRKTYYDLPEKIDLATRYHVADEIARYIEYDYLNYKRRWSVGR